MEVAIIAIILFLLIKSITNSKNQHRNGKKCGQSSDTNETDLIITEKDVADIDFKKAYQARYLLTKNEWHEFKALQKIADLKGYIICPKVRLLDIIEPIKGQKKYMTLFYKVQSKHVDFVICDRDVHIKAIIELDDSSHDKEDRKERDQFVNEILQSVGYKVIHTRAITPDILDLI